MAMILSRYKGVEMKFHTKVPMKARGIEEMEGYLGITDCNDCSVLQINYGQTHKEHDVVQVRVCIAHTKLVLSRFV